jgi:hypothetical protein
MKASALLLINGASFGPDTLRVIGQAFDEAWEAIAGNFPSAIQKRSSLPG